MEDLHADRCATSMLDIRDTQENRVLEEQLSEEHLSRRAAEPIPRSPQ
jgi:hypothetical protein